MAVATIPVATFVKVTLAPGTAAPCSSMTLPRTVAVSNWARAADGISRTKAASQAGSSRRVNVDMSPLRKGMSRRETVVRNASARARISAACKAQATPAGRSAAGGWGAQETAAPISFAWRRTGSGEGRRRRELGAEELADRCDQRLRRRRFGQHAVEHALQRTVVERR